MQIRKLAPVLAALVVLTACGIRPPRPNPPKPPDPPPAEAVPLGIYVHDSRSATMPIEGVLVVCTPAVNDPRTTDAEGRATVTAYRGQQSDCTFTREGYHDQTASALGGVDAELPAWMAAIPPPHPISAYARQGAAVRVNGATFVDDSGYVLPLYAHFGDGFHLWVRDNARALDQLDKVAGANYQGVRVWGTLGCGSATAPDGCRPGDYWRGREVGPDITPDYWGQVRAFGIALRDRGLRAVWSQGDIGQIRDRPDYMRNLARISNELGGVFDFVDGGNEAWQTGEPDPRKLADFVGHYLGAGGAGVVTLTSPPGEGKAELDAMSIPPAGAYDVHTYRDGHSWDKRRHIFSIPYEVKPNLPVGIGSEPPGGGELVSVTANKHEMDDESVPMLALASMLGRQAFVWFSGEGVKLRAGLEGEPGFASTPRAVGWLPRDVMSWPDYFHSGDSWRHVRIVAATGEARVDCRRAGDRFACTIDGPPGSYRFPVERSFSGRVCNPADGSCVDVGRTAGETLDVTFTRGRYFDGRIH